MDTFRRCLQILLTLAIICWSIPPSAASVERGPLAHALGMPGFRASMISQIALIEKLAAGPFPTLSPIMNAAPTASDPGRAEAARLIGVLLRDQEALDSSQATLRVSLGAEAAASFLQTAKRLKLEAAKNSGLRAQLNNLGSGLDLNDHQSIQDFQSRLDGLYDKSTSRTGSISGGAVLASGEKALPKEARLQPSSRKIKSLRTIEVRPDHGPSIYVDGKFPTAKLEAAFKAALTRVGPPLPGVELAILNSPMWGDNPQIVIRIDGREVYWEYLIHSEANLARVRLSWKHPLTWLRALRFLRGGRSDDLSDQFAAALLLARESAMKVRRRP